MYSTEGDNFSIETMADEDLCVSVRPRSSGKPRGKAPTIGGPWTAVVGGYVHSITGEPYVKGQNKKETDAAYEKKRRQWRDAAHRLLHLQTWMNLKKKMLQGQYPGTRRYDSAPGEGPPG